MLKYNVPKAITKDVNGNCFLNVIRNIKQAIAKNKFKKIFIWLTGF